MINKIIFEKMVEQAEAFKQKLSNPLSEQYSEELRMYYNGTLHIISDDIESEIAKLQTLALDKSDDTVFSDFVQNTVIDENAAIESFKNSLSIFFAEAKQDALLLQTGAIMIEYDWYYHYDSLAILLTNNFKYPHITEPRYLKELAPSFFIKGYNGPDFRLAWPDCSEVEEKGELLGMDSTLMNYYQYYSRLLLHKALDEMNKTGELDILENLPFVFYINEHDCEVMSLYVKEIK